jgi:hypothetical protein
VKALHSAGACNSQICKIVAAAAGIAIRWVMACTAINTKAMVGS